MSVTEHDSVLAEIARTVADMRFINYRLARLAGRSAEQLAPHFPQAESFERMFQEESK